MRELSAQVAVVGAGPAGVAAACVAAERGTDVVLVDENPAPGGQIWRRGSGDMPAAARRWMERLATSGVCCVTGTTVVDANGPQDLFLQTNDGVARLRTDSTVLATGSRELFLPFPGWTLPGVVGAGGIQALSKTGWPVVGSRVAIAGSGPLLLAVAAHLRTLGARVVALIEQAPRRQLSRMTSALLRHPAKLMQAARLTGTLRGVPRYYGSWPVRAEGTETVEALVFATPRGERRIQCDLIGCGFGLVPETRLARLLGAEVDGEQILVGDQQETTVRGLYAAGESTGVGGVDVALAEGQVAGAAAAGDVASARRHARKRDRERTFAAALDRAFALRPELGRIAHDDTIVCRCEDVTIGEVAACNDTRDAKLRTRCGMGACQGRVCGPAVRRLRGWATDRVRTPLIPIPTAALAEISAAQTSEGTS